MPTLKTVKIVGHDKKEENDSKKEKSSTVPSAKDTKKKSNANKTTATIGAESPLGNKRQNEINMISPSSVQETEPPKRKGNQLTLGSFFGPIKSNKLKPTTTKPKERQALVKEKKQASNAPTNASTMAKIADIVVAEKSSSSPAAAGGAEVNDDDDHKGDIKAALPENDSNQANFQKLDAKPKQLKSKQTNIRTALQRSKSDVHVAAPLTGIHSKDAKGRTKDSPSRKPRRETARPFLQTSVLLKEASTTDERPKELTEEQQTLLKELKDRRLRYTRRANELIEGARDGLEEESFSFPSLQATNEESSPDLEFSDPVVANMAIIIEGSPMALSKLAKHACERLEKVHTKSWSPESVTNKIKLMAKRKSYLSISNEKVDLFEDENVDRMWRWEVIATDLFPKEFGAKVKKARNARKKLSSQYLATVKLTSSLRDAENAVGNSSASDYKSLVAKTSTDEDRVLNFEREAEKKRLAKQAKRRKQEEEDSKRREREQAAEERRQLKELKRQEAEQKKQDFEKKKQEAAQAREESKRKKAQEKEEKEEQKKKELERKKREEEQKNASLSKQKRTFLSFFSAQSGEDPKSNANQSTSTLSNRSQSMKRKVESDRYQKFDADQFRSMINSQHSSVDEPIFSQLTLSGRRSRMRRTKLVPVSIYITVQPDNQFDAQPFAERRIINVPNRYRYLSFHEDCRPPYHGTWSKQSSVVTGRTPFAKDGTHLDYDVDSEAEWEEGDDEIGEDIEDDDKNQDDEVDDEEGDPSRYNYQDGFCVADDEYLAIDENVDEDTKVLYKKKLESGQEGETAQPDRLCGNVISIIAPVFGGHPLEKGSKDTSVEGLQTKEAVNLVESHKGYILTSMNACLDAFPPLLLDEIEVPGEQPSPADTVPLGKDEYSKEDMETFVRFVHHSVHTSKEKLIDELKSSHTDSFSSKAKAHRKLDTIAVKKNSSTGVFWEVKKEILQELGLHDLLAKKFADEIDPVELGKVDQAKQKETKSKGGKSTNDNASNGKKRKSSSGENGADAVSVVENKKNIDTESAKKKKKEVMDLSASANLMAAFLKRGKTKDNPTPEKQSDQSPKATK